MNFAIGIVLYNCNIDKICKTIEEYIKKAKNIILVDNNSENIQTIETIIKNYKNIILIKNSKNEGIAVALNQILKTAYNKNVDYLLTLDQDSFLQFKYLEKMAEYINDDVAIVCPEIIDLNKKKNKIISSEYQSVPRCITSGSFMNLSVCKKIGDFDEKMFIDYVDFDYSKRITLAGYKIYKIKDCFLQHEIGKRTTRKFLWIDVYPTNHSEFRVYYYFRNMHYYYLKFKKQMKLKEKINEIVRICWKYVSIVLYEKDKIKKIKSANRGFADSKKMFE